MASWISLILVATASMIAIAEPRVTPAKPTSVMMDADSSPVIFLREKRTVARPYPHRAMMFTGYYRPIRRSGNDGHATGLFAQGNAVSGQAFFSGMHVPHLKDGPEPIEEPEVSSAQAQAAPTSDEEHHHHYHHQNEVHHHEEKQYEHRHHEEEKHHHHHQDSPTSLEHHEQEKIPLTTEIAQPADEPITTGTEVSIARPKVHHTKKTHKTPVTDEADEDEDEEDEEDEDDDEPIAPFVPFKNNRRRQGFPHLNNFFPMVFSFPRVATRGGSSDSLPGAITAIANSYSTGKGGTASSVATAYGGSPVGKKRRPQPYEE